MFTTWNDVNEKIENDLDSFLGEGKGGVPPKKKMKNSKKDYYDKDDEEDDEEMESFSGLDNLDLEAIKRKRIKKMRGRKKTKAKQYYRKHRAKILKKQKKRRKKPAFKRRQKRRKRMAKGKKTKPRTRLVMTSIQDSLENLMNLIDATKNESIDYAKDVMWVLERTKKIAERLKVKFNELNESKENEFFKDVVLCCEGIANEAGDNYEDLYYPAKIDALDSNAVSEAKEVATEMAEEIFGLIYIYNNKK